MNKYLKFRQFFLRKKILRSLASAGKNFVFDPFSIIVYPQHMQVGNNVFIGEKAHISAKVIMGNNIMFGPRPMILGGDHFFAVSGKSIRFLKPPHDENFLEIHIEDETWFGAGVIILGGTVIGMGSVVGAGSVVSRNIPPFTVSTGTPAKPIKLIFTDQVLSNHLSQLGYPKSFATEIVTRRRKELAESGCDINDLPVIDRTREYEQLWKGKNESA